MLIPYLSDIVNAYKGLLKEKEALSASLATLSKPKDDNAIEESSETQNIDHKQTIQTLMQSIATLSAGKSKIEQTFLMDKRNLKQEIAMKDKAYKELESKIHSLDSRNNLETENFKSKLIVEKHEREKEQTNSMLMIRELQMLLNGKIIKSFVWCYTE